jgi:hypothetical protein
LQPALNRPHHGNDEDGRRERREYLARLRQRRGGKYRRDDGDGSL